MTAVIEIMKTAEFYRTQTGIIDNVKMTLSLSGRRKHKHLGVGSADHVTRDNDVTKKMHESHFRVKIF